ncbi:MAG TPA: DUF6766 family protein [Thermoanaerobaculia bacterium]|nr:DUF6766 family protein [Thermoanaerobaculia bacterium]
MQKFLRDNGLCIVSFILFFSTLILGQSLAGHHEHNQDRLDHGKGTVSYTQYLKSSHFWEATTENWESEFLQMFIYVVLTAFLYQRGSAESKDPDKPNDVDRDPRKSKDNPDAPWPVRQGGFLLKLYENSLSLAFLLLFLLSFWLHAASGAREYSEEELLHGGEPVTTLEYMQESRFWFESLQNWQSEFLSIWAMVYFSIYLRQRSSPESKPVDAPHSATGTG